MSHLQEINLDKLIGLKYLDKAFCPALDRCSSLCSHHLLPRRCHICLGPLGFIYFMMMKGRYLGPKAVKFTRLFAASRGAAKKDGPSLAQEDNFGAA